MTENKNEIIDNITSNINDFFESKNNKFTKKEFADFISKVAKDSYDTYYSSKKKGTKKTSKKDSDNDSQEKPKRPLSEYQIYMKEQMTILKAREDGKKPNDLMKEIGEMWKAKKNKQAEEPNEEK